MPILFAHSLTLKALNTKLPNKNGSQIMQNVVEIISIEGASDCVVLDDGERIDWEAQLSSNVSGSETTNFWDAVELEHQSSTSVSE